MILIINMLSQWEKKHRTALKYNLNLDLCLNLTQKCGNPVESKFHLQIIHCLPRKERK